MKKSFFLATAIISSAIAFSGSMLEAQTSSVSVNFTGPQGTAINGGAYTGQSAGAVPVLDTGWNDAAATANGSFSAGSLISI